MKSMPTWVAVALIVVEGTVLAALVHVSRDIALWQRHVWINVVAGALLFTAVGGVIPAMLAMSPRLRRHSRGSILWVWAAAVACFGVYVVGSA